MTGNILIAWGFLLVYGSICAAIIATVIVEQLVQIWRER